MRSYPEIAALRAYFDDFTIEISRSDAFIRDDLFFVQLSIDQKHWNILVDDEYRDFSPNKPLVNWFLVLNALEAYRETDDFLLWSKQQHSDPSNATLLAYYRSLSTIYHDIERIIGKIDACISPYDYSLRTGVVIALLESGF